MWKKTIWSFSEKVAPWYTEDLDVMVVSLSMSPWDETNKLSLFSFSSFAIVVACDVMVILKVMGSS